MNQKMTSALALASAAAVAAGMAAVAIASSDAFADDITIDNKPFVSTTTRAEVKSQLKRSDLPPVDEWSLQQNQASNQTSRSQSTVTPAQARAEYVANRDAVRALTAEDSGSSYFWKMPKGATSVMGGAAR